MIKCIIVAEGGCNGEIFEFATPEEANAFKDGVMEGSSRYGCGSCSAYSIEDLEDLDPKDEYDAEAIGHIKEFLS